MLNNVLKLGVCALCVYFIGSEENKNSIHKENSAKYNAVDNLDNNTNLDVKEVVKLNNNVSNTTELSDIQKNKIFIKYLNLTNELKQRGILKNDSKLLSVEFANDEVILNVNDNFLNIGGTYAEREVLNEFIKIGLSYDEIKYVTFLVNNKITETSEGIDVYKMNKLFILN